MSSTVSAAAATSEYSIDTVIAPPEGRRFHKIGNAVSQREKFRSILLDKFLTKHVRNSTGNENSESQLVNGIVNEIDYFFAEQTMSEKNMAVLKQRINRLAGNSSNNGAAAVNRASKKQARNAQKESNSSAQRQKSLPSSQILNPIDSLKKSVVFNHKQPSTSQTLDATAEPQPLSNQAGIVSLQSLVQNRPKRTEQTDSNSETSERERVDQLSYSKGSAYINMRQEAQWANYVDSDVRAFKKEQVMNRYRSLNQKQTLKAELDRQLEEKKGQTQSMRSDHQHYFKLSQDILNSQIVAETQKEIERANHRRAERALIEKQKIDQEQKRLQDRVINKQIEESILQRIAQEQVEEENKKQFKRKFERDRQQVILVENSQNKSRIKAEAAEERRHDIESQRQYLKLLDAQEDARQKEKRERLERVQQLTKQYELTVKKDMRDQQRADDERMLRSILEVNRREDEKEESKRKQLHEQQIEVNATLARQIDEKKRRLAEEEQLNQRQAKIWRDDRDNYLKMDSEKQKVQSEVKKSNQNYLLDQIQHKNYRLPMTVLRSIVANQNNSINN